jgi:oxalate decarboxylase
MGVFNSGPHVLTMDFNPGDIGYVPRNYGHYVQNIGDTDAILLRVPDFEFSGVLLVRLA